MNVSWPVPLLLGGMLVAIVLILFLPTPGSRRRARVPIDSSRPIFRDDDRYWYAGIFYNNPDDPAVFVPRRFGLGWTVNFGNPMGRMFFIGLLLIILLLGVILPLLFAVLFPGAPSIGCHPSGCHMLP